MVFPFKTLSGAPSMNQALWPAMPPPIWKLPHPALLVWVPWFMVVAPSVEPWGTTPGVRATRFMMLRPLSGISCTCSPETTELSAPVSVCSKRRRGHDFDDLGDGPDFQRDVDADRGFHLHRDRLACHVLEAGHLHVEPVVGRHQVDEPVVACRIRDSRNASGSFRCWSR